MRIFSPLSITLFILFLTTPFAYALNQPFVVTPQYTLRTGEHRHYIIALASQQGLNISSLKEGESFENATFISEIPLDFCPVEIVLESSLEEGSQDKVNPHQNLIVTSDTGRVHTLSLREVLSQAFKNRDKRLKEERVQRKEKHDAALEEYQSSWEYTLAQTYIITDGFLKGFIPFDDDLIPQAINTYILNTTPEKMVLEDLKSRDLIGEFSAEDSLQFQSLNREHEIAVAAGLTALVAIPTVIKGRQWYRARQTTKARQMAEIARIEAQAPAKLASASPQVVSGAQEVLTKLEQIKYFWSRPMIISASKTGGLQLKSTLKNLITTHFDKDKLKRAAVFMGMTELAWAGGEFIANPLFKGKMNEAGQITYNFAFINTLTGSILLIVSSKTSLVKKGILMIIATDIVSPPFQYLQNIIDGQPDKPYDPIQTTWDKAYLTLYCIPKNVAMMGIQGFFERRFIARGITELRSKAIVQTPTALANEAMGNVPYTLLVEPGKELLREHIAPMMEENQFDLEKFLEESEIENVIVIEAPPEGLSTQ